MDDAPRRVAVVLVEWCRDLGGLDLISTGSITGELDLISTGSITDGVDLISAGSIAGGLDRLDRRGGRRVGGLGWMHEDREIQR